MGKLMPALALAVVSVIVVTGCGSASTARGVARRGASDSPVVAHLSGRLLSDEDDDDQPGHFRPSSTLDSDSDFDHDSPHENAGYLDYDDSIVGDFGHPASAEDTRSATGFVKRYFAVAAAEDGAVACSMLYRIYADTVVEDDGSSASPLYQRGKTCAIVMTKIFTHLHAELTAPAEVVAVRVKGPMAYVLLGSTTRPASYVRLHREGGGWKLYGVIERPLP